MGDFARRHLPGLIGVPLGGALNTLGLRQALTEKRTIYPGMIGNKPLPESLGKSVA
ncbi:hypothetical protein P3G55_06790 [Leptospira sp. 96542]|nr:hypothetical protein [Leptospira sp. 96542]